MWINTHTLNTYTTHSEIRSAFPGVSFPDVLTEDSIASVGVVPVTLTNQLAFDPLTQKAVEAKPALIDGVWTQQWVVSDLTQEERQEVALKVKAEIVDATQKRLDDFAKTRLYDGILSLCTYATSAVPKFRSDGQYGVEARDATWAKLYEVLAEVESGARPAPSSFTDIEPELPVLAWP